MKRVVTAMVLALTVSGCSEDAGEKTPGSNEPQAENPGTPVATNAFRPDAWAYSDELRAQLRVPENFSVTAYATGMGNARMMQVTPDGGLYVTRPNSGDVVYLRDTNADGVADENRVVVDGLKNVHGIALSGSTLFLVTPKEVISYDVESDGSLTDATVLVSDLPDGGQHGKRTVRLGQDGFLYVSVGSTCNACIETNEEAATILRIKADGTERTTYATGLRNTIGYDWHPETGELWGFDHGSDDRGDDAPPDELNRIVALNDYGWPFAYGNKVVDTKVDPPPGSTREAKAAASTGSVLDYQAHSAPIDFVFYRGSQFPAAYRGDAFVPMRGSWNRYPATGYKLVRVHFENGQPVGFEDFLTGFLIEDGRAHFGRIAGLATLADGSMLLSEDENGVIYRIAYSGPTE